MGRNLDFVSTVYTDVFTTQTGERQLNYNFYSIGIKNKGNGEVKVYISRYSPESYVIIPGDSFSELAVTGNYVRFEYLNGTSYNLELSYLTYSTSDFKVPRFPNLIIQGSDGNDYTYDPINTGGFFTETYNFGQSTYKPYNSESIIEVDYYFNGNKLAASSTNFYNVFFENFISTFITSLYPYSSVNNVLQVLPGGQQSEIAAKVKDFFEQLDRPLNDEYVGGWAKLTSFDRGLSLLTYTFNAGDKIHFPFYLMGFVVKNNGTTTATIDYKKDSNPVTTITLAPNASQFIQLEETNYIEVTSGSNIELSFSGYLVKLMEFAPIINIYYPLGFDEANGKPAQAYSTFTSWLADFENNLQNAKFTGRVIKYKWVQHIAQEAVVYDADYWNFVQADNKIPLPFDEIRPYLRDWYAYRKYESDLVKKVTDQNQSTLVSIPKDLYDVINDDNITVVLYQNFSSYTPGVARKNAKKQFLLNLLFEEYLGNYGRGGLSYGVGIYN